MAKVHIVLQGKGGVGKSMIASLLAQYQISKGRKPLCIDTDPINQTFSGYKGLPVVRLDILENDEINPRKFDQLVEMVAQANDDVIIDNGASSFIRLTNYLISNEVPDLLANMGHELVVHTAITGGQAMLDTLNGFNQLAQHIPANCQFVVWLNPYWGEIIENGKSFEQMKAYQANKDRITAVIRIPSLQAETFGRDLSDLLQSRKTFDEALSSGDLTIMAKQRLSLTKGKIFSEMAMVL